MLGVDALLHLGRNLDSIGHAVSAGAVGALLHAMNTSQKVTIHAAPSALTLAPLTRTYNQEGLLCTCYGQWEVERMARALVTMVWLLPKIDSSLVDQVEAEVSRLQEEFNPSLYERWLMLICDVCS
jgi:hypothetical protein